MTPQRALIAALLLAALVGWARFQDSHAAPTSKEFAAACTAAGGVAMQTLDGPDCLKIEIIPILVVQP